MFESKIVRTETFISKFEAMGSCTVELWLDPISEIECEYNVRTRYERHIMDGSRFEHIVGNTVESHHSMKSALRSYNYELQTLGDPDYEAHKASN
jgi:hypothetical protein